MVPAFFDQTLMDDWIQPCGEEQHPLGNQGFFAAYPDSEEKIAALLGSAHRQRRSVIPEGGGTKRGFGGTVEKADCLLSLSRYKGIVDYAQGDMTITVKAGTTVGEIGRFLQPYRQMLPLDPAWPELATIGGVIAANDSGPKRCRYGSARDAVIGLRVVYPDGRIIRTGGKVVKNVAGYDMNKLFVGSMGTLGVISEVTLKLRPLPQYQSLILLSFPDHDLQKIHDFVVALQDSANEPVTLELLNPALFARLQPGKEGYALAVCFEDVEKAVHYQEEWVIRHQPKGSALNILPSREAARWWEAFSRVFPHGARPAEEIGPEMVLKVSSRNMDVLSVLAACQRLGEELELEVQCHGGAGHGISRCLVNGETSRYPAFVHELRKWVSAKAGHVIIQHAPLPIRREIGVWGEKPAYFPLLEGIKRAIDPHRVLNAKRFVGGI